VKKALETVKAGIVEERRKQAEKYSRMFK